jgi:hypothetical protein
MNGEVGMRNAEYVGHLVGQIELDSDRRNKTSAG